MKSITALLAEGAAVSVLATVFVAMSLPAAAQGEHLSITQPGGMPGMPVITGIEQVTNGVRLTWDGPSGYYQLFRKLGLTNATWQPVGGFNLSNQAAVTAIYSNAFFRVSGPSPQYAGVQVCTECHAAVHDSVMITPHAGAFTNRLFVNQGGQTNSSCLPCHTVGFGLPTGFVSQPKTPKLAGVQCENCHGPAANHAANPDDLTARPRVELAATVCGGCHNSKFIPASVAAFHRPLYEEWNSSPHQAVLDELKADFLSASGPTVFIPTCGRCHSGTVREAFLENTPMPDGHEAGAVGIACATCHDPHEVFVHTNGLNGAVVINNQLGAVYTNQLRNPLASLEDYHTSGNFTTNYNEEINVCGQCHNDRGASAASTDRPPHHSPQYNMLLGTVGELDPDLPPNQPGTHAMLEKQCVTCHMQTADYAGPAQPGVAGHKFELNSYEACATCHGSATTASNSVVFLSTFITSRIEQVKASLDKWATNNAPASLRTKYGTRAWEYSTPGDLSPGGPGPTSAEWALVPNDTGTRDHIQKARFNLYLVFYDGSQGVHNPFYSLDLLSFANNWVQQELDK